MKSKKKIALGLKKICSKREKVIRRRDSTHEGNREKEIRAKEMKGIG